MGTTPRSDPSSAPPSASRSNSEPPPGRLRATIDQMMAERSVRRRDEAVNTHVPQRTAPTIGSRCANDPSWPGQLSLYTKAGYTTATVPLRHNDLGCAMDSWEESIYCLLDSNGAHGISGMPSPRQIFRPRRFGISVWRGTASTEPVEGFIQREWLRPSRFSTHPWSRRCFSRALRFTRLESQKPPR